METTIPFVTTPSAVTKAPTDTIVYNSEGFASLNPEIQPLLSSIVTRIDMLKIYLWSRAPTPRSALRNRKFMHSTPQAHAYSSEDYLTQIILVGEFGRATLIYAFILLERYVSSSKLNGG